MAEQKRLDRPELREKIIKLLGWKFSLANQRKADLILALIPDIEELQRKIAYWREKCYNDTMSAKKSGWDDAVKFFNVGIDKLPVEDAKREERERIVEELNSLKSDTTLDFAIEVAEWLAKQALKEDK